MARSELRRRFAISISSVLIIFALAELILRSAGFSHRVLELPIAVWNANEDAVLESESGLHQLDVHQLWSLRPGAPISEEGEERINAAGWRGPEIPRERTPGVLRIATLGDSSVFGFRVEWEETFSAQLERLLEERGVPAEVMGCGVIGFTSLTGLWRYRELVRAYRPDVVIAGFGAINEYFPGVISDAAKIRRNEERARSWWRVARTLREELRVLHLLSWMIDRATDRKQHLTDAWYGEHRRQMAEGLDPALASWGGVRRMEVGEYEEAMTSLVREIRADGALPLLISMPRTREKERTTPVLLGYTEGLERVAAQEGLELVDIRGLFRALEDAGVAEQELFLPADPVHPSPRGHLEMARALVPRVLAGTE